MNKVAVTGANGMTGSHMVSLLKTKKIPVKKITRKIWDLRKWKSFKELDQIFGSISAVFHFGAQLNHCYSNYSNLQTQNIFNTNVRSCLNLAEWAKLRDIPIIFISSSLIYKDPHAPKIIETDETNNEFGSLGELGGLYGYTKILQENILKYFLTCGLKCIILRPSSLYGYGLPSDKLVQNYINIASSGGLIKVNRPNNKVNFIHAHDVSRAALQAYNKKLWGRIFNISSKKPSTILQVAKNAVSISGKGKIIILNDNKRNTSFTRFNLSSKLANKIFRFTPILSLKEGMMLVKKKHLIPQFKIRKKNTS